MVLRIMLVFVCLLASGCSQMPPTYTSTYTPRVEAPYSAPSPISLPPNAQAVFIGDSWTEGYSATPEDRGYAYLTASAMGWTPIVYSAASTGYTKGNKEGTVPRYAERIPLLPDTGAQIVIVQGSVNDFDTDKIRDFPALVGEVVQAANEKFPGAAVVLFGPCPYSDPPTDTLRGLDARIRLGAEQHSVRYVSCYGEGWITPSNIDEIIDPDTAHPGTEGHAYLASRLTADLRDFINP